MKLSDQLEEMVNDFCEEIKLKLLKRQKVGYRGYNLPHMQGPIEQKLKRNLAQKDWVDVGALAAMRWKFTNNRIQTDAKEPHR